MIPLPLLWTLLTVSLWTSGSSQILQQEAVKVLYPKISSTVVIDCDCMSTSCDSVYWFCSISNHRKVMFLGSCNKAGREHHRDGVDKARFKLGQKGSASFTLQISNVTKEDAGIYSCILRDKNTEMLRPGTILRPGVSPPALPPKTKPKPPVNSVCRCSKKISSQDGCGSAVLWPLVGLIAALALALVCTLYYFSRLPKKCRHHFVKKR